MQHIFLDRTSTKSLSKQLYEHLKYAMLSGELKPHERLESSRVLAKGLNIARNIVIDCYEQLEAEGYIYTRPSSGTYVNEGLQLTLEKAKADKGEHSSELRQRIDAKEKPDGNDADKELICFRTGIPDLNQIPMKQWASIYKKCMQDLSAVELDYQNPMGNLKLRHELAAYLGRARGVITTANNIVITSGAAQGFTILSHLFHKEDYALVENPLSYGILHTLQSNHVNMRPISVDEQGMQTVNLPKESERAPKMIFTTPSHQFPTGVILTAKRRIALIEYAVRNNCMIVEDDYDSEFRYEGDPIPSMQQLNPSAVIYVGTFSKTLMPALRIGYLVLPDQLVASIRALKYVEDIHSSNLEQVALAEFMKNGFYERHISRMKKLYLRKRNELILCLNNSFHGDVVILGEAAGLHLVAKFNKLKITKEKLLQLEENAIEITPVQKHYLTLDKGHKYDNALVFGYGNVPLNLIGQGIERMKGILADRRI